MTKTAELLSDPLLRMVPTVEGYKVLDRVVLYSKLGEGGMGAVYRGIHLTLSMDVAVKCMKTPPGAHEEEMISRFLREARLAARISSPHLVRVFDVNQVDSLHYLVMEYVLGETTRDRVRRRGRPSIGEACAIALGAAKGVADAHEAGVIHRDIKPDNILVSREGVVKVADLGLAKSGLGDDNLQTMTNAVMGTPRYMPPEQFESAAKVGPAADVYSLGATMHFLLTGQDPYPNKSFTEILRVIHMQPFPDVRTIRPDVPDDIAEIVTCATRQDPDSRYENAGELALALEHNLKRFASKPNLSDPDAGAQAGKESLVTPPTAGELARISSQLSSRGMAQQMPPAARASAVRSAVSHMAVAATEQQQVAHEATRPSAMRESRRVPEKKKSSAGLVVTVVLLLLAVGGYFGYEKFKPADGPTSDPSGTPPPSDSSSSNVVKVDPREALERGRREIMDASTLDRGIASLRAALAADPAIEGARTLLSQALRGKLETLSRAENWSQAVVLAREVAEVEPGEASSDLVARTEDTLRARLLQRLAGVEPASGTAVGEGAAIRGAITSGGIARVLVDGREVPIISGRIQADLGPLQEGERTIEIEVVDESGVSAKELRTITVDTRPPELSVSSPAPGARVGARLVVAGRVDDATKCEVRCGDAVLTDHSGPFEFDLTLDSGNQSITVEATDAAGHIVTKKVDVRVDAAAPTISLPDDVGTWITRDGPMNPVIRVTDDGGALKARLDGRPVDVGADGRVRLELAPRRDQEWTEFVLEVEDATGNVTSRKLSAMLDTKPPEITEEPLASELPAGRHTWHGQVRDVAACRVVEPSDIAGPIENGIEWVFVLDDRRPSVRLHLVVEDLAGNRSEFDREFTCVTPCPDCVGAGLGLGECSQCRGKTTVQDNCPQCQGSRRILSTCGTCNGDGQSFCTRCGGQGQLRPERCRQCNGRKNIPCTFCNGGGKRETVCNDCKGAGVVGLPPILTVTCVPCGGSGKRFSDCTECRGKKVIVCILCSGVGTFAETCPDCNGRRRYGVCATCSGQRQIPLDCPNCRASGLVPIPCPRCRATGRCTTCNGSGRR